MEHHVTVGGRREWWSSEWQLWTTTVREQERISKIRARLYLRLRLVLKLGWTDERRRRTRERQVVRKKVSAATASPLYQPKRPRQHARITALPPSIIDGEEQALREASETLAAKAGDGPPARRA